MYRAAGLDPIKSFDFYLTGLWIRIHKGSAFIFSPGSGSRAILYVFYN